MDTSKGTSGESFVVRIVRAVSTNNSVAGPTPPASPSSRADSRSSQTGSNDRGSKRPAGFTGDPRPFGGSGPGLMGLRPLVVDVEHVHFLAIGSGHVLVVRHRVRVDERLDATRVHRLPRHRVGEGRFQDERLLRGVVLPLVRN